MKIIKKMLHNFQLVVSMLHQWLTSIKYRDAHGLANLSETGLCKRVQQCGLEWRLCWKVSGIAVWHLWEAAMSGSHKMSCQDIGYGDKKLMFLHVLCICPQNRRKAGWEEIMYCLVEPLAAIVTPLYPIQLLWNGGSVTIWGRFLLPLILKPLNGEDSLAFLGNLLCCLFLLITRKFCCWKKVEMCPEERGEGAWLWDLWRFLRRWLGA